MTAYNDLENTLACRRLQNTLSDSCHYPGIVHTTAMIVPVHAGKDCREFCLIEMQGEVHHEAGLRKGFCVGTMSAHPRDTDTVFLQIGYHRLEGRHVPLKAPVAVLRRRSPCPEEDKRKADDAGQATAAAPEYYVHGHIRSKYIFKSRPKALISQVS